MIVSLIASLRREKRQSQKDGRQGSRKDLPVILPTKKGRWCDFRQLQMNGPGKVFRELHLNLTKEREKVP
ncbi:hypothetical protein ACFL0Q_03385 [Thermodesulfobacteriota bacterium]